MRFIVTLFREFHCCYHWQERARVAALKSRALVSE